MEGLDIFDPEKLGIEHISSGQSIMVEAVVRPSSSMIHKTLQEVNFRSNFNLSVLAIHRKGKKLYHQKDKLRLQTSDTLLILGTKESINELRNEDELIFLDKAFRFTWRIQKVKHQ